MPIRKGKYNRKSRGRTREIIENLRVNGQHTYREYGSKLKLQTQEGKQRIHQAI